MGWVVDALGFVLGGGGLDTEESVSIHPPSTDRNHRSLPRLSHPTPQPKTHTPPQRGGGLGAGVHAGAELEGHARGGAAAGREHAQVLEGRGQVRAYACIIVYVYMY